MQSVIIRPAVPEDAAGLLEIYAPYVKRTAITFEYEAPSRAEFAARIGRTLARYPFLVALSGEEYLGYAYTGAFGGRAAYAHTAETAIYLRESARRRGIGRRLYEKLEEISVRQNILKLVAVVADCAREHEFLPKDSALFHAGMGFSPAGRLASCGYKFGRFYDIVWMEKTIGALSAPPGAFLPFPAVRGAWGSFSGGETAGT